MCPFDYTVVAGSGKVGARKPVNHTSWLTSVISTDRPNSVRNCCVIEYFCDVIYVTLFLLLCCVFGGFCHTTESDLAPMVFKAT